MVLYFFAKSADGRFAFCNIENNTIITGSEQEVRVALEKGSLPIVNLTLLNNEIVGIGGDIENYTVISPKGEVVGAPKCVYVGPKGSGYQVINPKGEVKLVKLEILKKVDLANATVEGDKVVYRQGKYEQVHPVKRFVEKKKPDVLGIAQADAVYIRPDDTMKEGETYYNTMQADADLVNMKIRTDRDIDLATIPDKHSSYDCSVKWQRLMSSIKMYNLMYFMRLSHLEVKFTRKAGSTMGVSPTCLFINPDFLAERTEPELLFVLIHEAFHALLGHNFRRGSDRDPFLWNIACDYIVNATIQRDFNIPAEKGASYNFLNNADSSTAASLRKKVYMITLPKDCVWNEQVDPEKDSVESIYAELMESQDKDVGGSGEQGDGSGDGSESQDGSGSGASDGSQSQDSTSQSSGGSSGMPSDSEDGAGGGGQQSSSDSSNKSNKGTGSSDGGPRNHEDVDACSGDGDDQNEGTWQYEAQHSYSFRGDKYNVKHVYNVDIHDKEVVNAPEGEAHNMKIQEGRMREFANNPLIDPSKNEGKSRGLVGTASTIDDFLKKLQAPFVDWRRYFESKLSKGTDVEYSYSHPDRRYVHSGLYVPGPWNPDTALKDVIVAIDCSGSMSEEDLGVAAGHIWNIYKKYKMNAYVVFWDTEVVDIVELQSKNDIRKLGRPSGGGTDVNCFVKWYKKALKQGIRFKRRFKGGGSRVIRKDIDPAGILVITDGYIGASEEIAPVGQDGSKFIWLVTTPEVYETFKPPYGARAVFHPD